MFKQRLFGMSTIIALCYGAAFMSATVYIPLFIQGVYGGTTQQTQVITFTDDVRISRNSAVRRIINN